jgi:hypothetical protein
MMEFHIETEKDKVTVYADVVKIEVEDIIGPSEDDIAETCYRTIRLITYYSEVIEIFCAAPDENALTLRRVKELKPVKKPKVVGWLEPKLYKPEKKK